VPEDFLPERDERTWRLESPPEGIAPECWWRGRGDSFRAEIALAQAASRPGASAIRDLWRTRSDGQQPVLLVVIYPHGGSPAAAVCGAVGDQPPIRWDLEPDYAARLAGAALDEPDGHAALRLIVESLGEVEEALPGVRNDGLLALHDLLDGVPTRPDWAAACDRARPKLDLKGRELVTELGFRTETADALSVELLVNERRRAVAVFLDEREDFDRTEPRFGGQSPISHALAVAERRGLPWVVLTRGRQIRLYSVKPDVGVGRRGRALTSFGLDLALLPTHRAGYLELVFSPRALDEDGTLEELLESSGRFAADLGARLRDRVYFDAVPALATAVARRATAGREPTEQDLADAYEQTLMILFRLLFVAYGEDRGLLPYDANELYRERSLKRLAVDLAERPGSGAAEFDPVQTDLWGRVRDLWRAVELGHTEWGVPAYGGSLFSSDPAVSPAGAAIGRLELANAEIGPALTAMLVDRTHEGSLGPVDFRSLSVREFGTIYEGLLESELSVAPTDLTVDRRGTYVPAGDGSEPVVRDGEVYFHDRSGARKATGSYFTKPFAVEHLLDRALMPALDTHLERVAGLLDAGDEAGAASAFFDFRCADLAMGSAHFLVAAVDRIEARFSGFLAEHRISGVERELEELRAAARTALGPLATGVEIETSSLLRRLVARRCIYGVDLNLIAVELARLALWIHTFVPGLPLSFLDRNLVQGNSLTGVATIEEAIEALDPTHGDQLSVLRDPLLAFLRRAEPHLRRLATIADATSADVDEARAAAVAAEESLRPLRIAFDLIVAHRLGEATLPGSVIEETLASHGDATAAAELARELQALHFPVAFPEVFLRDRHGFDCVMGNPPWDKVRFESQQFWVGREPGLNTLPAPRRDARIVELRAERPVDAVIETQERKLRETLQRLVSAGFVLQGGGHHDFAKLFVERALILTAQTGTLAYVLPRQCLVLRGWAELRKAVIRDALLTVDQCRNRGGWLFDDVEHRYMVSLVARIPSDRPVGTVRIAAGLVSIETLLSAGEASLEISVSEIASMSESFVIPWLNGEQDRLCFDALRSNVRLESGAGWIKGRSESSLWDFSGSGRHRNLASTEAADGCWRVLMTRHVDQYKITSDRFQRFINDPSLLVSLDRGVERQNGRLVLSRGHPLIVFRYPSRSDDARTLIATALPQSGFLFSTGYVHAIRHLDHTDDASLLALLGYFNSFTADWWARRFVDRHVTQSVVSNLPLPDWDQRTIVAVAEHVGALLRRRGAESLSGGRLLPGDAVDSSRSEENILAEIEQFVLRGFNLNADHLRLILEDFSDQGCPGPLRAALLERAA
jgi:hypothetical protein